MYHHSITLRVNPLPIAVDSRVEGELEWQRQPLESIWRGVVTPHLTLLPIHNPRPRGYNVVNFRLPVIKRLVYFKSKYSYILIQSSPENIFIFASSRLRGGVILPFVELWRFNRVRSLYVLFTTAGIIFLQIINWFLIRRHKAYTRTNITSRWLTRESRQRNEILNRRSGIRIMRLGSNSIPTIWRAFCIEPCYFVGKSQLRWLGREMCRQND